jgi:trans-aconitate methyltransferase
MSNSLFDKSSEYDAMLNQGLKFSGEDKHYFIRGRIDDLCRHLPKNFRPRRILDYGCGLGETAHFLSERFPEAEVLGIDTAANAIQYAKQHYESKRTSFTDQDSLEKNAFELIYCNGVFHHVPPKDRALLLQQIFAALKPGGFFALCENNPWNPGTQFVMKKIPFDRDAEMLSFIETQALMKTGGFVIQKTRFLFYFPRMLSVLRFLEPLGAQVPLGAQYYVLGQKP